MALNQNPTGSDNKNELTVEQGVAKEEVKADIIENGENQSFSSGSQEYYFARKIVVELAVERFDIVLEVV